MLALPINFGKWIEEHADKLQPPVNNYLVQRGDFIIMAVGGPNARTDYHVNETEVFVGAYTLSFFRCRQAGLTHPPTPPIHENSVRI